MVLNRSLWSAGKSGSYIIHLNEVYRTGFNLSEVVLAACYRTSTTGCEWKTPVQSPVPVEFLGFKKSGSVWWRCLFLEAALQNKLTFQREQSVSFLNRVWWFVSLGLGCSCHTDVWTRFRSHSPPREHLFPCVCVHVSSPLKTTCHRERL